jgi:transcription termination factor NusB
MKKTDKKSEPEKSSTPEQVSPAEALKRMKSFSGERKEKFIAAIRQSQN